MNDIIEIYKKEFPEHLFEVKDEKLFIDLIETKFKIKAINEEINTFCENCNETNINTFINVMKEYFIRREYMRKAQV